MKPILQFLSNEEIQFIHQSALQILNKIGFRFPLEEALELLRKAGAEITDNNIARIPANLVDYALKKVPKRQDVTLYGRVPETDVTFKGHRPAISCMTMATHVIDPYTRERRPATNNDLVGLTRLADQLENIIINGGLITPQEVPGEVNDWFTWATAIKNTTKHITGGVLGARGVRDAILMASAAVGGEKNFLERPFISGWVLSLPPLAIARDSLEALMEMSRWKIPSIVSSGPILGTSSPVTIAGTLAQAHAEILACLVVSQVVNPGAPFVYTSFARGMDMKTGNVSMACPEFGILKAGMAQMGHFLGLPVRMPGMLRDAKMLDAQAGFETGLVGTVTALTADIIDAMQLDSDLLVDFADLVFCNECMGALKRLSRELTVEEDTLALEIIKEVGPGGSFLTHDHTFENFQKELWQPQVMERRNWDNWEADGCKDIREVALQRTIEILETEPSSRLSPEVEAEIDNVVREAELDYTGRR